MISDANNNDIEDKVGRLLAALENELQSIDT